MGMVKPYICHKKNCWSTKFSVLQEAASREEDHFNENLIQRATPHTHKKPSEVIDNNEEVITNAVNQVKTEKDEELNQYKISSQNYIYETINNQKKDSDDESYSVKNHPSEMGGMISLAPH